MGQVTRKILIKQKPEWMPAEMGEMKGRVVLKFRFSEAERRVYRKRAMIPVSEWAERHRFVTRGPLEGTKFRKGTVPYSPAIMDAIFWPSVEEAVMCTADQVAKSFIADTCLGYAADRAPGPALIVYPDENTAIEAMKDRIAPMFNMSPRLRSYMSGTRDDETAKRINLSHMQIYAAWARSPIQLANRSIKYLILDETDKYPMTAGTREADPVSKAEKRVRVFRYGKKIIKCSTPTTETGVIWTEINSCQVVFEYHVTCPDCGHVHLMNFQQIKWPDDVRDPVKVKNEALAYYVCPGCGSCWTDLKRDAAVKWGKWVAMGKSLDGKTEYEGVAHSTSSGSARLELFEYLKKYKPKKIGFHIPSWLSPFVEISDVAAAFLKGLKNKNHLKDFNNSHRAYPWTDWTQERKEDRILELRDERPRGRVPGIDDLRLTIDDGKSKTGEAESSKLKAESGIVACLTAGIDTQDDGFWYEIIAWGWPDADLDMTSWQTREGFVTSFDGLKKIILDDRYKERDGREHYVRLALQDAMGHRTDKVYDFCRMHRGVIIPTQGVDRRTMTQPHAWSNIETYPGTKKPIPGGLKLLRFDTTYYKNILAAKLEINRDDPGAWHLHSETTEEWARQLCAEVFDPEKNIWVQIASMANHAWDCGVLNILAADILGVKYMRPQAAAQGAERKAQGEKREEGKKWIGKRKGKWLR
jgi:phage terminase large subunit GpA-like protein